MSQRPSGVPPTASPQHVASVTHEGLLWLGDWSVHINRNVILFPSAS